MKPIVSEAKIEAITGRLSRMMIKPYTVKHTRLGWWVDGRCGYCVSGIYDTREEAVQAAKMAITKAKKEGKTPPWLF